MKIDLVVLNTHPPSYIQDMADRITSTAFSASDPTFVDVPGGVFVRRQDLLNARPAADAPGHRANAFLLSGADAGPGARHRAAR